MTALLTTPSRDGRPCSAKEINKFYREEGPKIFSKEAEIMNSVVKPLMKSFDPLPGGSFMSKMIELPKSWLLKAGVWALAKAFAPVYDNSPFHQKIAQLFGGIHLADTLTNVVIPAYDMKTLHPIIFSTEQAKKNRSKIQLADVIMSTAAAPFYFPPHDFVADGKRYFLVDGGLAANNPTLVAIREAAKMIENHSNTNSILPENCKFLVLSLGTGSAKLFGHEVGYGGTLDWFNLEKGLPPLIDILMRASDDMVDMYTSLILGKYNSKHNFLRIQDYTLDPCQSMLNDASEGNIDMLEKIVKDLLNRSVSVVNLETGLQEIPLDRRPSHNRSIPTNREAITCFAGRLSEERRRRYNSDAE
ncbi:Patatin [Quillaja saponaria]|uniref:Patatin n=1 Tax=Quillaja saponaria TaxID=32244 RepID=A0AAD7VEQ3_QUISA|nr:Patatin [Quillaja saponaria]